MLKQVKSRVNKLARVLRDEIDEEGINQIIDTAEQINEKIGLVSDGNGQGLLFGQVQSGKTNNMLMTIAKASDNGHRLFVVLTSDNLWLYEQTLERVQESLPGLLTLGKDSWNVDSMTSRVETALKHTGVVLVATKNSRILPKMKEFIEQHISNNLRAIIFDDEADQASLNTLANSDKDELSRINGDIVDIRNYFERHVFIQVTATPQALFLQGANTTFRPDFTIIFKPGKGYVGGESFFEENSHTMRLFQDTEIESLMNGENYENIHNGLAIPTGLRQALCTFFIGAALKICEGEGTNYTFLCHVSHKQDDHKRLETIINGFITKLTLALHEDDMPEREIVYGYLHEAYLDLSQTNENLPSFIEIVEEVAENITSTQSQLLISGSHFKRPNYKSPFNILIGGNKLGRGVTIKRLLVTYYGRTSQAPKLDTILQHARMYGYRKSDLGVSRFFTTNTIWDVFKEVYSSEKRLRDVIEKSNPDDLQALVLSRTSQSILRPTRSNVLYVDSILFYMPGKRYFPRYPMESHVEILDDVLKPYENKKDLTLVKIQDLIEILNLTKSEKTEGGSWDDEAIIACLKNMKEMYNNQGYIAVRTGRDITKGSRSMLSPDDNTLFNGAGPTLTIYKYNGKEENGWNNKPLWVPNLRFPDGKTYFMFSTVDITSEN
ncbi:MULTISPECIES: Z1 domain-containing protein [Peribacillus]|uniref:Z1 domain-containing protein n=1 Tax=Peribacillus TaxID=2675229 RepID=UPI0024C0747D|nr:Z1 domain-containing protein [Peribacillus simplex]WHY96638.1 Z1 domain-containing protein [Peribacillus simplex]